MDVTTVAEDFDGGSTDADGDMLMFSVDVAAPYPLGTTDIVLTVSDGIATDMCMTTITVEDNTDPTIVCNSGNGNIVVSSAAGECSAVVLFANQTDDNCTGFTVEQTVGLASGEVFPIGVTTNTFVVTDASGNTAECSFSVTVNDTSCRPSLATTPSKS